MNEETPGPIRTAILVFAMSGAVASMTVAADPGIQDEERAIESIRSIQSILEAGSLAEEPNPLVLDFLVDEEARFGTLPDPVRHRAVDQLATALREKTLVSPFGALNEMGGPMGIAGRAMKEGMKRQFSPENLLRKAVGARPRGADTGRARERFEEILVDPWARGLAAARALSRAGFEADAVDFYRRCLAQPTLAAGPQGWGGWVVTSCRRDLIDLGAGTAAPILSELAAEGQPALGIDFEALAAMARMYGEEMEAPKIEPVPQIQAQGLEGLAEIFERGEPVAERRRLVDLALSSLSDRKADEELRAAAARMLGAAREPRARRPLERLAGKKKWPRLQWAANRALAIGFGDGDAISWLEKRLERNPTDDDWQAFEVLVELDRPSAWRWAERQLGRGSVPMDETDWRTLLLDRLGSLGDERSLELLRDAERPDAEVENYQQALLEVALFRRGERGRITELERSIERENWDLGRRAPGEWWRLLEPLVQAAAMVAAGLPVGNQEQLVADFAFGALDRHRAQERRKAAAVDAFRFKVASALAGWDAARAIPVIARLLQLEAPSTRLAAARSLLAQTDPAAVDVIAQALELDYGSEEGGSRNPEIRAALLVHGLETFPEEPVVEDLLRDARGSAAPSVSFLALASGEVGGPARGS